MASGTRSLGEKQIRSVLSVLRSDTWAGGENVSKQGQNAILFKSATGLGIANNTDLYNGSSQRVEGSERRDLIF